MGFGFVRQWQNLAWEIFSSPKKLSELFNVACSFLDSLPRQHSRTLPLFDFRLEPERKDPADGKE
jgi:hypothetical protein